MANILRKWIESDRRELRRINKIANKVESYADQMAALSDDQLKAKTTEFKKRVQEQGPGRGQAGLGVVPVPRSNHGGDCPP